MTNANSQIPAFAVGMPVRVARTSAPTTTYMQGEITAFTASTGSTTVNVSSSLGSGTHTDWTITIGGHQTTASASPLGVAAGGTGAGTAGAALTALGGVGTGANSSITSLSGLTTPLTVAQGGTGTASYAAGDMVYASGTTTIAKLAKGSASQVLTMNSGATAPEWATTSSSGAYDLNGGVLTLAADGNTTITADTNDQIDFSVGGTDTVKITTSGIGSNAVRGGRVAAAVEGYTWPSYLQRFYVTGNDYGTARIDHNPSQASSYALYIQEGIKP